MRPWRRLIGFVALRPWLAFLLMGLSFFLFAVTSINLVGLFKANIELILDHGLMAIADGAAIQLLELLFYGYLSGAFFVLFKTCEKLLVDRLIQHD
jgi:hypothetical protein